MGEFWVFAVPIVLNGSVVFLVLIEAVMMNVQNEAPMQLPAPHMGELHNAVQRRNEVLGKAIIALDDLYSLLEVNDATANGLRKFLCQHSWYNEGLSVHAEEKLRGCIDRAVWLDLVRNTKMGMTLNATQLEAIEKDINCTSPILEKDLVVDLFLSLFENRQKTFTEGLIYVFRRLATTYKSHSAFKIKKKLIINDALSDNGWVTSRKDLFDDFFKYLLTIDGIDPTAYKNNELPSYEIENSRRDCSVLDMEFEYFSVKCYINGNIHILMHKRLDLVDKINELITNYYGESIPKD